MGQKNFSKVISTLSGDVLVMKDNGDNGNEFRLQITCITNHGIMATISPKFPSELAREAHYVTYDQRAASIFIQNMEKQFDNKEAASGN